MRIVFTGGRNYEDYVMVLEVFNILNPTEVYVGDCPTGLDKIVRGLCEDAEIPCKVYEADWDKLGKIAGPIRNALMVKEAGFEALVVAFAGGKGTENCVKEAVSQNMIVFRVEK